MLTVGSSPVDHKTPTPERPRLSGESLVRVENIERSAEKMLAERARVYTPGDPSFFPSVTNIQAGGHRVIDLVCDYAEAIIKGYLAEYERLGLEDIPGILRGYVFPEVRNRAQLKWAAWLLAVGIGCAGNRSKLLTTDKTDGGPEVRARFSRRRRDPDLTVKVRELHARFQNELQAALSVDRLGPRQRDLSNRRSEDASAAAKREYLRRQMDSKGLSALDLAKSAVLDYKTVRAYLGGTRKAYASTRQKVAKALELDVDDLP